VKIAVVKMPSRCAPSLLLGIATRLHASHVAYVTMMPKSTIMYQWSLGVETAACLLRGLVGGLLVEGGS
jgi:hypothetical protein